MSGSCSSRKRADGLLFFVYGSLLTGEQATAAAMTQFIEQYGGIAGNGYSTEQANG